jgi:DNA mismatch repair protein MutL
LLDVGRIALLSDELVNQIAAGEVVERPASVVKELVENSIDAGAHSIDVLVEEGGLEKIDVRDDGLGMSREDAALSVLRHATSKLKSVEGLSAIRTKGFRGEALSAIAAVSRLRLTTAESGAAYGTEVTVEHGGRVQLGAAPPSPGTRVEVRELFFNTPARRKFMKRPSTELSHVQEAIVRLALAHPEVGFSLEHEGRTLLSAPAGDGDLQERIGLALGAEIYPHLLELDEEELGLWVSGYLGSPELSFPNSRGLYTYVNRRYVRDRGLNHAIQRAFQDLLPGGRHPFVVGFIQLDSHAVDVNVHPQKLEVRFVNPRMVYDVLFAAMRNALRRTTSPAKEQQGPGGESVLGSHYALAVESFLSRAQQAGSGGALPLSSAAEAADSDFARSLAFGEARPDINQAPPPGFFSALRYLGALAGRYWICEGAGATLVLVDPHAAIERLELNRMRGALERDRADPLQRSLFAASLDLGQEQSAVLMRHQALLERLGLELEPFGRTGLALKSLPSSLIGVDAKPLLESLAAELSRPGRMSEAAGKSRAMQVLACRAAASNKWQLPSEEVDRLLQRLEGADLSASCAHPVLVLLQVPFLELERRSR